MIKYMNAEETTEVTDTQTTSKNCQIEIISPIYTK